MNVYCAVYLYYIHRGYDWAHRISCLCFIRCGLLYLCLHKCPCRNVHVRVGQSFLHTRKESQLSNLKEISPNHHFKPRTFWEKVKAGFLETEFQTPKVIQIVFCLQGYPGTQLEVFFVSVRIPTPKADHHWTVAPYDDEGITQVQKLPALCGPKVWSPRAEIPRHLGTCGSMGCVLAKTALKWFLLRTTCGALQVCSP